MSFIVREFEDQRKRERDGLKHSLLKSEAIRFGASSIDPIESEREFLHKFKKIRSRFKCNDDVIAATENVCSQLKAQSFMLEMPFRDSEPKTILDLL